MSEEFVVLLLLLLVGYGVLSGLKYETFGVPRPIEYFTRDEITIDEVTKGSDSADSMNRNDEGSTDTKD